MSHFVVGQVPGHQTSYLYFTSSCHSFPDMVSECFGIFSNNNGAASETADVEKHGGQDIQQGPLGFAALSSLMASDGDQELLIFRRFDDISARNLLYLQCELLSIEDRLKKWDRNVLRSRNTKLEEVAYRWEEMVKQAKEGKDEAKEMMELVYQLRSKIKEYRKSAHDLLLGSYSHVQQTRHWNFKVEWPDFILRTKELSKWPAMSFGEDLWKPTASNHRQ